MTQSSLFASLRVLIGFCLAALICPVAIAQNVAVMKPSPQQIAWQDLEFGVIVHFNPNTWLDQEWGDGSASPKVFNPMHVDPGQWARAAKAAGAKYLILVAKHHDGFALWPTAQSEYSVKNSPWMGRQRRCGEVDRRSGASARGWGSESTFRRGIVMSRSMPMLMPTISFTRGATC